MLKKDELVAAFVSLECDTLKKMQLEFCPVRKFGGEKSCFCLHLACVPKQSHPRSTWTIEPSALVACLTGARNYKALNETLQRALLICAAACVPISFLWSNSQPLLMQLGQPESIASGAAR